MLNRTYKATPDYSAPSKMKFGMNNGTPVEADTDLDYPVPVENGTINDDGDNQFTGSSGGTNTTDNTTTFKPGGGVTDNTSQNLIANATNATKTWTIADLSINGTDGDKTKPFGLWLYIKDSTALAKLKNAGTALSLRWRTNGDAANKYYEKAYEDGDVSTGWNWLSSGITDVEDLTAGAGGAPSGDLDEFIIEITTNNATDTFTTGDILFDLLRQWSESDTLVSFVSGFPSFNETDKKVTVQGFISSVQANGFDINSLGVFNTDTPKKCCQIITFTAKSKSNTDEFSFDVQNNL